MYVISRLETGWKLCQGNETECGESAYTLLLNIEFRIHNNYKNPKLNNNIHKTIIVINDNNNYYNKSNNMYNPRYNVEDYDDDHLQGTASYKVPDRDFRRKNFGTFSSVVTFLQTDRLTVRSFRDRCVLLL